MARDASNSDPEPSPLTDSSSEGPSPASQGSLPDIDATTISKSPLLDLNIAYSGLKPRELGLALVGQQIGDIVLEELIGAGGMGAVLRGHDLELQRTVAIKVLSTHQIGGEASAKRFQMEARSAARLDHPCIARVYQVGEDRGLRYILFEYIEGANIRDLVAKQGSFSIADVLRVSVQIADALTHAWKRNVVHRDIKPSNILITGERQAKLVDMGLARFYEMEPTEQAEQDLTATGMTIGTFDYIAPEQARDPRTADTRCDIYSLGCTMFYMLTGQPPFPGGTPLQKLLSHQGDQPPDLASLRRDVPAALATVVGRMLAKEPDHRYQTPSELTTALLETADKLGIARLGLSTVAGGIPLPSASMAWLRVLPWALPTALLLAGIVAIATFWHPAEPPTDLSADPLRAPAVDTSAIEP